MTEILLRLKCLQFQFFCLSFYPSSNLQWSSPERSGVQ